VLHSETAVDSVHIGNDVGRHYQLPRLIFLKLLEKLCVFTASFFIPHLTRFGQVAELIALAKLDYEV